MIASPKIEFETHLTVNPKKSTDVDIFAEICRELGGKPLLIELEKGENPQQLMMSKCIYRENLKQVLDVCKNDGEFFSVEGFILNRIKIEVDFNFADLFREKHQRNYFEWHGKIELKSYEQLLEICRKYEAHLSKNSLKSENGFRFITLREYKNKTAFETRVSSLVETLQANGWQLLKQQSEFCVFDSNILLDKGWLEY